MTVCSRILFSHMLSSNRKSPIKRMVFNITIRSSFRGSCHMWSYSYFGDSITSLTKNVSLLI